MEDQRRIALQKEMQKKKKPGEEAKSPEEKDGKDAGEGKKKPEGRSGQRMTRAHRCALMLACPRARTPVAP